MFTGSSDPDIGLAGVGPPALVKTASGFFAEPSACEHFVHERRKSELRASALREPHGQVVCDVHENVEAGNVDSTKCGALRPADRGACHRIDLLDRVPAGGERLKNADEAMHGDMIGDESRRVLRDDDVLAEPPISELAHCGDDCRVGVCRSG